ncbi:hypothetical protein BMF94_3504 [Rhodotorula taiwanensis]|uniref:Uncharacterized protein n=1 Tax=Rhodotorula taiwanensis TaxID=741276 RepID=A0A2S5B9W9_9BASI|nr:hypothetical protein BMF94_3504 [Rhodotorula taiwanensis]
MTAINCVMLSARGDPIPLPGEKFLYNSTATVSISLFRRPEGADFSVQPRKGHEYKATGGTVYVSQRRIVYVAREAAVAGSSSSAGSGATAAIQLGSLAAGQASLAPDAQILAAPGKVQLATLSVPLRFYVDGHLVQPWLSANYVEALCITDNSADGLVGPHICRLHFKEGGAYEFYTAVEEVKARAELSGSRRDTPVEQLPAYTVDTSRVVAAPTASTPAATDSDSLAPPPRMIPPRTAPSPADLVAAETARAAEESERLQRERDEIPSTTQSAGVPAVQAGEAPPGYSV